jgi:hypothetical protein
MPTFASFAALGSLVFAAAGVVVLLTVTLRYRERPDAAGDEPGEIPEAAPRVSTVRRAYGIVLGCFAAAAALGVLGVVQRSPDSVDRLVERIRALEHRLDAAEMELEARAVATAALATIDRRSATTNDGPKGERFPREVPDADAHPPSVAKAPHGNSGSVTMQKEKPTVSRAANNARRPAPSQPVEKPSPSTQPPPEAAPTSLADESPTSVASSLAAPPSAPVSPASLSPVVSAPLPSVAAAPPLAERDAQRRGTPSDSSHPTLAEKVRSDWEAIKRAAREGGDDWVDGWRRLRRFFSD